MGLRRQNGYALKIFLPFLLRARNIFRPFFVLILLRNPCTFLRLLTLGRNVGLIVASHLLNGTLLIYYRHDRDTSIH